jgi:hypothetical protein
MVASMGCNEGEIGDPGTESDSDADGLVLVAEAERAIANSPKKRESGRYAVYVPCAVVIGTCGEEITAP